MNYSVKINYKEDDVHCIIVPEKQIKQFFSDISKGQMWINDETKHGFWTSFNYVKNIIVTPGTDEMIDETVLP